MRGADGKNVRRRLIAEETSPHAWSRSVNQLRADLEARNISTCVEQIICPLSPSRCTWKHLHMRGADSSSSSHWPCRGETSPHAWSRCLHRDGDAEKVGNISTCVEQIATCPHRPSERRKHLHMRGADGEGSSVNQYKWETSPHAWSRFPFGVPKDERLGNISTCVEQMKSPSTSPKWRRKHLHMRGADS